MTPLGQEEARLEVNTVTMILGLLCPICHVIVCHHLIYSAIAQIETDLAQHSISVFLNIEL